MGIKDNFSQAMKELTNPRSSENRKEVKDVAAYMNDTADTQPGEPAQNVQSKQDNTQPSQTFGANSQEQNVQNAQQSTAANGGFAGQNAGQDFSQRIARDMNDQYNQNNSFAQNMQSAQNNQNNGFAQSAQDNSFNQGMQSNPNNQNNDFAQNMQNAQNGGFAQDNGGSGFGGTPFASGMRTDGAQEMTVISKNTMIDGNVRSFADKKIDGNIKGNVETTKNININGKVVGDLTCDNISMKNSAIQGNVRLKGQAVMANDSMLIGDLTSQVAQLNGKIKGNIEISGKIQLDRDSVIIGDIKAGSIAISDGAVINGFVTTTYLSKDESANIFPESIALGE